MYVCIFLYILLNASFSCQLELVIFPSSLRQQISNFKDSSLYSGQLNLWSRFAFQFSPFPAPFAKHLGTVPNGPFRNWYHSHTFVLQLSQFFRCLSICLNVHFILFSM